MNKLVVEMSAWQGAGPLGPSSCLFGIYHSNAVRPAVALCLKMAKTFFNALMFCVLGFIMNGKLAEQVDAVIRLPGPVNII